jgi:hypothetical protein
MIACVSFSCACFPPIPYPPPVLAPAGSESLELVPLLLQPADSDLLKLAAAEEQEEQAATREVKRPRRGKGSARLEAAPPTPSDKAKAAAAADTQDVAGAADAGPAADSSCWQALQALRLQADLFRRNAEVLAGEGNEEDVSLVGAILDVSDCCQRVQEVSEMYGPVGSGRVRRLGFVRGVLAGGSAGSWAGPAG